MSHGADTIFANAAAAERLVRVAEATRAPYGFERSVRVVPGRVLADRFLISMPNVWREAPAELCERIGAPPAVRDAIDAELRRARFVHLGFEEDGGRATYKLYAERSAPPAGTGIVGTVPLYVASKWNPDDPARFVQSHYVWFRGLDTHGIRERVRRSYENDADAGDIALAVIDRALDLLADEDVRYMEVTEPGSARRSFDVNIYDAGLTVRDCLISTLDPMGRHCRIPTDELDGLFGRIGDKRFGHLSGGVHRDGRPFFTLYYGAETRSPAGGARR